MLAGVFNGIANAQHEVNSVHILFAAVTRCSSANLLHFGVGVYGR